MAPGPTLLRHNLHFGTTSINIQMAPATFLAARLASLLRALLGIGRGAWDINVINRENGRGRKAGRR